MPPTQEMIRNAARALAGVRLESFTISPATILPFQQATLEWRVMVGTDHPVALRLTGGGLNAAVGPQGSRVVSPPVTTTYRLVASSPPLSKVVVSRSLEVDDSGCYDLTKPESEVRKDVKEIVDEILIGRPELSRRRDDVVEVEPSGIHISLRFKARVTNWADPDVDIDAVIGLRAEGGEVRYTLTRYEFDIDHPWWADLAHGSFMPAWLAAALREGSEEREVRGLLVSRVAALEVKQQQELDEMGFRILTLTMKPNEVCYTVCPR